MLSTGQYGQLPLAAADGAQQRHRVRAALLIPQRLGLFLRYGAALDQPLQRRSRRVVLAFDPADIALTASELERGLKQIGE